MALCATRGTHSTLPRLNHQCRSGNATCDGLIGDTAEGLSGLGEKIRWAMGIFLDIAIAGAGPAGLAAALYLKRAGHRVTIFERFDAPKPVGSGLILQPTGLTVLADLGLLDDILVLGSRIDRLHGADAKTGRTVLDVRYDAQRGGRFGLAVHRAAFFGVLFRAVRREAIAIETGRRARDAGNADLRQRAKDRAVRSGVRCQRFALQLRQRVQNPGKPRPLA